MGCWDTWDEEEGSVLVNVADLESFDCLGGTLLDGEDLLTGEVDEGEDKDAIVFELIEPVLPRAIDVRSDWKREQTKSLN